MWRRTRLHGRSFLGWRAAPGSPYGLDPLVALLCAGGRDAVGLVLALHHLAVPVGLAGLDLLATAGGVVKLQAELQGEGLCIRVCWDGDGGRDIPSASVSPSV